MDAASTATTTVRIHINREPKNAPTPTTANALYALGNVPAHQELFREVAGNDEDVEVGRGDYLLHLKEDEHFYSERDYKIIVNARPKETTKRELSFAEVVHLAFPTPPTGANVKFTVVYRNGPPRNPEGSLTEGKHVVVKDGMVFNVTPTDKS